MKQCGTSTAEPLYEAGMGREPTLPYRLTVLYGKLLRRYLDLQNS